MFIPTDPMMQKFYKMVQESVFSGAEEDALTLMLRFTQMVIDDVKAVKASREAAQQQARFGFRNVKQNKEYLVLMRDLDAFCAEHRLDKNKLMEMNNGKAKEYKGWQRAQNIGGIVGIEYRTPIEVREGWDKIVKRDQEELSIMEKLHKREMEKTKLVPMPEKVTYQPKGSK